MHYAPMTPEQDKEILGLLKEHARAQKYMVAAIAMPGIVIVLIGGLFLWSEF